MRLYLEAYGLTEARFYATSFLIWLALVLLWFVATVQRGRRRWFAFGALVSAFILAALLQAVNPDAIIVRTTLARAQAGAELDAAYISHLSADAAPAVIAALPQLDTDARCRIAAGLLRRWGPDVRLDWRNWSWSAARARAAVRADEAALRSAAEPCLRPRR